MITLAVQVDDNQYDNAALKVAGNQYEDAGRKG
jgi:hypothetical protein